MKPIAISLVIGALICISEAHAADPSRGELLYDTHCVACHTTQMHWRDQRLATDWNTLGAQVRRWQESVRLNWNEDDITAVTSYLNRLYYHFPDRSADKAVSQKP